MSGHSWFDKGSLGLCVSLGGWLKRPTKPKCLCCVPPDVDFMGTHERMACAQFVTKTSSRGRTTVAESAPQVRWLPEIHQHSAKPLEQGWPNYGPGANCVPRLSFIQSP